MAFAHHTHVVFECTFLAGSSPFGVPLHTRSLPRFLSRLRKSLHIDDPRMDSILDKCVELSMPVNIHVGEEKWMYEPMDQTNDGLMNAWKWRVVHDPGVLQHDEVVDTLERAVKKHPRTIFIACHLANCCSDLGRLGAMLDKYPNLYADIGARYAELSPIPRTVSQFFHRYQDRLLYGTDIVP